MWQDWEVVDNLGSGTFGSVYEVHRKIFSHTDKAALKVLSIPKSKSDIQELLYNGYDQKSITERFKNHLEDIVKEYALMSELKGCANVVYCDDVRYIQHEDGIGWDIHIKMELLHPLISVLKNPVDEKQVVKIGLDICNALVLCNEKNIIHRDIKPQNLFVSDDGTFKLGDFGIAKTAEKTMGGTKTGTYNYMAPEVYNNQPYGAAADQYSLGMVLYWLLNERRMPFFPLPPEIPTATQEEQARQKRMLGETPPMPKNGNNALKAVVMKSISPKPEDRFSNITEMKNALKSVELQLTGYTDEAVIVSKPEPILENLEDVSFAGDFFEPSGDSSVGITELSFEDEVIPSADSTMGNSWGFDEGSVGPGENFNKLFDDFKDEGTIGVKNEMPKKENLEEIKHKEEPEVEVKLEHEPVKQENVSDLKPVSIDENAPTGMVHYELDKVLFADVTTIKLVGHTYKFTVDYGNTKELTEQKWYYNEPKIIKGEGSQFAPLPAKAGTHILNVAVHKYSDRKCEEEPLYTCPPINFEVRSKQTTTIKAVGPTDKGPLTLKVEYPWEDEDPETSIKTNDGGTDIPGPIVFHALNDNISPLALANGATYKFFIDGGNRDESKCKEYSVVAGPREKKVIGEATTGKVHTVELKIYGSNDQSCLKTPIYTCPPVSFEMRHGYTTRIIANRPSPLKKLKVEVRYEKK